MSKGYIKKIACVGYNTGHFNIKLRSTSDLRDRLHRVHGHDLILLGSLHVQ